ncbi:MAG: VOC family protein [Halobacteriaceae archaeon]
MSESRARAVGINHVALAAFVDLGDQFIALSEGGDGRDDHRHFGLVVDDPAAVEAALDGTAGERLDTAGLDFRDPWGNRVQVVAYREVQFSKADHVREAMGLPGEKSEDALAELAEKGMAPD